MTLRELKAGQTARVETVGGKGALRQHFLDMGVIPGAEVTLVKLAPMGDPMELRISASACSTARRSWRAPPRTGSPPPIPASARRASSTPRARASRCRRERC